MIKYILTAFLFMQSAVAETADSEDPAIDFKAIVDRCNDIYPQTFSNMGNLQKCRYFAYFNLILSSTYPWTHQWRIGHGSWTYSDVDNSIMSYQPPPSVMDNNLTPEQLQLIKALYTDETIDLTPEQLQLIKALYTDETIDSSPQLGDTATPEGMSDN